MRRLFPIWIVGAVLMLAGCHGSDSDGMSADDVKKSEEINALAKSSGGDWSKLTPQQQQMMVQEAGGEGTARQILQMKAHPPTPVAPGAPNRPGP